MDQVQSSGSDKEVFDPVDETWMMSSFPLTDSYFSRINQSKPIENTVTDECISNVYDNFHHQENVEITENKTSTNYSSLVNSVSPPRHDSNQVKRDHDGETGLQSTSEKNGGIGRSFTDLTKIGLEERKTDVNHNGSRITKFENGENNSATKKLINDEESPSILEKSALSKEMMETFSEELNELEGKPNNKKASVTEL